MKERFSRTERLKCWSIICIYVEIAKDSDGVILGTVTEKVNAIIEKRENGFEDNEWQLKWGIIGDIIRSYKDMRYKIRGCLGRIVPKSK